MSTATFSRAHTWALDELIKSADLNAEFNNILNNLNPPGVGDYSDTQAMMQIQTSPGGLGTESLATSLAGELERLRYVIAEITGNTYWYQAPSNSIAGLVAALGSGLPPNRISAGKTTGNSSMLAALIPAGTTASVTLTASSTTPFQYYVNGTAYSITASQSIALALASSTAATAQVSLFDTVAITTDYGQSKGMGMYNTIMGVVTANATFANFVGQICALKLTGTLSGTAEYAVGYVQSTSQITNLWRGCFIDQSANRVIQQDLSHTAATPTVVNVLKMSWIFANTNGSLAVTYDSPVISAVQPGSPATGDYWFDLTTTAWKTFNSTTWVQANATLIGLAVQDSANCVAARTFEKYVAVSALSEMPLTQSSTAAISAESWFSEVSVFGNLNQFGASRPSWNQTATDTGVVISASSTYILYMKENGTPIVSNQFPLHRRDLLGLYHPQETWRAVGSVLTDANTAFITTPKSFNGSSRADFFLLDPLFYGTAGYTNNLWGVGGQATAQLNWLTRFPASGYIVNTTSAGAGANAWQDIATVALTPGLYAFSGSFLPVWETGTPANTQVAFACGQSQGTGASSQYLGINQAQTYFSYVFSGNATVSNATSAGNFTGAITLPAGQLPGGISAVIPRFVFEVGIASTNFYVKYNVVNTASGGYLGYFCGYLFERLDVTQGVPI